MTPPAVAQASSARRSVAGAGDQRPSPVVFALDRLFPKRGRPPYATLERLVVLVIIRAMGPDEETGEWNCFVSYPTIGKWSGVSLASVKRMLQRHCDGPAPLFYRTKSGRTRGRLHTCYRFTLVRHPEKFVAARDAARAERGKEVERALRDLQPERLALQRQRVDFGGPLSDAEYRIRLAALEKATRRRTRRMGGVPQTTRGPEAHSRRPNATSKSSVAGG
ncbi:MAG: hypothetical protein ABL986_22895 [Vicinamibacterales bacterium]